MKWFMEVFLPSLEKKYNERKGKIWLTAKQVSVCKRYMGPSGITRGLWEVSSGEKTYIIQVAPNGCASLNILVDGWIQTDTRK